VHTQFYAELLDEISDGVYFVNRNREITYWNGGAERITGYTAAEVSGHSCAEGILRHVTDTGRQLCRRGCPLAAVMTDGGSRQADLYLHHKDGHRVPVRVRARSLRDDRGRVVGSVEVFTTRTSSSDQPDRRAPVDGSLDPVTGLAPRRLGELHLQTLLRAVAEHGASLGVLFIDADDFKNVNDTYGHQTGDQVLRMVGQSLANALRRGDIPMRWGGEEFVALLPGTDVAGLHASAERVRMLIANSWIQKGSELIRVTVSVGASMALPTDTPDRLIERVDRHMYASKHAGRNRVTTDAGELVSTAEAPILRLGPRCPEARP
jgi:diguanylate cyclase (GGDEF)-like protein/PAS domain S-box-containing protein